ncbi:hypothetical protein IQ255_28690 [Pleurocapsales cyanobacterium LEGE 10410]|nr:hypothetical protein [Pleurocapsales cyanobacterium LEGE 10410]
MNAKLIDSLVQIINSLSEEERENLEAKLKANRISKQKSFDFANQPFVGMWQDRNDLADSSNWIRQLRQSEWTSKHD